MARIRTIKPELFKHDKLFDTEIESGLPIRTAFMGILTVCDREGRFKWNPRRLKIEILPYDELDFSDVLNALLNSGFIKHYIVDGEEYGFMPTFTRHQFINNKESNSDYPEYHLQYDVNNTLATEISQVENQKVTGDSHVNHTSTTGDSHVNHTSTTGDSHVNHTSTTGKGKDQGERKGKEGKGKEQEQEQDKRLVSAETVHDDSAPASENSAKPKKKPGKLKVEIQEVFEYWQDVMCHPNAKLDSDRTRRITNTLNNGYSVQQIKNAISGCKKTDFNMGINPRNQIYDGLNVILKNADNIDRFIRNNQQEIRVPASDRAHRNDQVCDDFMRQMTGGSYQDPMTEGEIYEHQKH